MTVNKIESSSYINHMHTITMIAIPEFTEFCEICHENFPGTSVSTVACKSTVAHKLCHYCEGEWRIQMPVQEDGPSAGNRIMICPKCRVPEDPEERTKESLQREVVRLNRLLDTTSAATSDEIDEAFLDEFMVGLDFGDGDLDFSSDFNLNDFTLPSSVTVRPLRVACASGRGECRSRSQDGISLTKRKCTLCNVVPCCRNCNVCVGCAIPV